MGDEFLRRRGWHPPGTARNPDAGFGEAALHFGRVHRLANSDATGHGDNRMHDRVLVDVHHVVGLGTVPAPLNYVVKK